LLIDPNHKNARQKKSEALRAHKRANLWVV
jgi:hypothetical protein